MRKILAHSAVRWMGVTILLSAYILVSQGWIRGDGIAYQVINAVGSGFMIINSLAMQPRDWAVSVFNMVWVAIGIFTIAKIIF